MLLEIALVAVGEGRHVAAELRHTFGANDVIWRRWPLLADCGDVVALHEGHRVLIGVLRKDQREPGEVADLLAQSGDMFSCCWRVCLGRGSGEVPGALLGE